MVETFTIKATSSAQSQHDVKPHAQLTEEDEMFYIELKEPLNALLMEPSQSTLNAVLDYAKQFT